MKWVSAWEARGSRELTTAGSLWPRVIAAAKYASKVFPLVGALMALRKIQDRYLWLENVSTQKKKTYPTIPSPQWSVFLQKNQMAVTQKSYWTKGEKGNKDVCLLTFLIVRDLDGKLRPILQTRIKTHSTGPVQIRTRILEGTLCRGKSEFAPA